MPQEDDKMIIIIIVWFLGTLQIMSNMLVDEWASVFGLSQFYTKW
jgi:hypothetical protein